MRTMRIRVHSQNLTGNWGSSVKGPMWKHGRAWIHIGEQLTAHMEWALLRRASFCGASVKIGKQEDELAFFLGLPRLFNIWWSFNRLLPHRWFGNWRYWGAFGRETGWHISDSALRIHLWDNDDTGRSIRLPLRGVHLRQDEGGFGWSISIYPLDIILGRLEYYERILSPAQPAFVSLPEGKYLVTVELKESIWKRPRWPKEKRILRANIESERGIPSHAGKGENEWDMDDDLLFGMTCPAVTVEEAVQKVANSILKDRKRYGEPDLPDKQGDTHVR